MSGENHLERLERELAALCGPQRRTTASLAVSSDVCRDKPAGGVPGDVAGGADDRWARSVHRAYPATGARAVVPGGCNGLQADAGVPVRRAMPDLGPFVPDCVDSGYLRSVLLNDRWRAKGG